jgi:transposase
MVRGEEALEIRRLYAEGVSISELARRTGHDRKTIRRIVRAESPAERSARRRRESKLAPFREYVLQRMELGVLNAVRIHAELQELGYRGGLTVLREFMRPHRPTHTARATPRYETPPGQQAQLDLFHFDYLAGTVIRRLYYLALVLIYSRYAYGEFLPQLNKLTVLQALRRGLEFLAGAPAEILSDNTSVLVRRRHPDGRVEWQPEYLDMAEYYGFLPRACRPYWARTKGKNERFGRYVRQAFWPREFVDLADLNRQHLAWLDGVANVRIHGTTHERPVDRWQRERTYLRPLPRTPIVLARTEVRQVAWDGTFSWNRSRYSVPVAYAGRPVLVRELESGELVVEAAGEVLLRCPVSRERFGVRIDPAHYAGLPRHIPRPHHRPLGIQQVPEVERRPLAVYEQLAGVRDDG